MKLAKETKAKLHKILTDIKQGPLLGRHGICLEVWRRDEDFYHDEAKETLNRLFKTWPKFSGNSRYPIRSSIRKPPSYSFLKGVEKGNNWDKRTKYGRLRWELLDFLIEQTKPEA